jgi:hypothetical protein
MVVAIPRLHMVHRAGQMEGGSLADLRVGVKTAQEAQRSAQLNLTSCAQIDMAFRPMEKTASARLPSSKSSMLSRLTPMPSSN